MKRLSAIQVAAIQMDARVGQVEANLAHATELVEQAAAQGAQLVVLPELFSVGYEYTDRTYALPEALDGPTGSWIARTAHRLNLHLVGSFPARMPEGTYIVAMLAAPDGRHWIYRKVHVAMWENCYFDRGAGPVIAETKLGRIGLLVCWDQVFADLARVYQGRVDLLCIPSSPPTWLGTIEDADGVVVAHLEELRSFGNTLDGVDWFQRAQELHARTASVPVVYAARCGTFHSPMPLGFSFLLALPPRETLRVLRAAGTRYRLRCPMMGRSCILNAQGERIASTGQDGEAVLVATVQPGTADPATLPVTGTPAGLPVPRGRSLVPGIPRSQFLFDDSMITWGRWYRRRHQR
jgi:predicted amidohydrolase